MRIILILLSFFFFTSVNAGDFTITSAKLVPDHQIPIVFTCDGKNISPSLSWANPPADTVSFAVLLYSPDSVVGVYYNWIIYNIPPTLMSLKEGANNDLPDDVMNANNTAGDDIYRGPCPPDTGLHHYIFEVAALNAMLDLSNEDDVATIVRTIAKHTIKSTSLSVLFNH